MTSPAALRLGVVLGVLVLGVACDELTVIAPEAATVDLGSAEIEMVVGETLPLGAIVRDENGNQLSSHPVSWSSSEPSVATVTSAGVLEAIAVGTTTVSVSSGSASASALVTVTNPPVIGVTPSAANFSASAGGSNPGAQTIEITNLGAGSVQGLTTSISYDSGSDWLSAQLSTTTAPATLTLSATTGSLTEGTYTARVDLAADTAANSPLSVPVTFTVGAEAPGIRLSESVVSFAAVRGGPNPTPRTVDVTNGGAVPLTGLTTTTTGYLGGATGWVNTALSVTTAPATLTVSPQTTALAAGTHAATVEVASAVAVNSPQSVTVSVAVPGVALSPTSENITIALGSSAQSVIALSNAGAGSLSGYNAAVSYTSGGGAAWLTPSFSGDSMTLSTSSVGLAAGVTYEATVTVTAAEDVIGAPFVFTMNVTAPPAIGLAPTNVALFDTAATAPATATIAVSNVGTGTLEGLSASVIYSGGGSGWLAAAISPTTAPATITLTAAPAALAPGTYSATVSVASSSAGVGNNPSLTSVSLTVGPRPTISLTPTSTSFATWQGGPNPSGASVAVANSGSGTLTGLSTSITYGAGGSGWLSATPSGTTAPATIALNASTGALTAGTYSATVNVLSSAGRVTNSPRAIDVTFTVAPPPVITLNPSTLTFDGTASVSGPAGSQSVNITNTGGGVLTGLSVESITYASGSGWLTATPSGTTAPASVDVSANSIALAAGTYNATIHVGSTTAGVANSPQPIGVTFNVAVPPINTEPRIPLDRLPLGRTSVGTAPARTLRFESETGLPDPGSKVVRVSGASDGLVGGLAASITYLPIAGACTASATGWLTTSVGRSNAPAEVEVRPLRGALATGTYCARVQISSSTGMNGPEDLVVEFNIP